MSALDILEIPDSAAVIDDLAASPARLSWPDFRRRLSGIAAAIPVPHGARCVVGIQGDNGLETLMTIFAAIEAGLVPAPFAPAIDAGIRDACLAHLEAAALWTTADGWRPLAGKERKPQGFDLVMHSSGSTGLPKPIAIRLAAMRDNARDVGRAAAIGRDDSHFGTMSHCYMSGLYNAAVLPLVLGGTAIAGPLIGATNIAAFAGGMKRHRPAVVWVNPLVARMLTRLRDVPADLFGATRRVISCTAPLPPQTKTDFEAKFGQPLLQSYGLSETLITTLEDPDELAPGTVGKPVGAPGAVFLDDNGQVIVANSGLCAGYLESGPGADPVAVAASFSTGDLGVFDERGNLVVTGRLSEFINRDGVKFPPERIERALAEIPHVEDSAVVSYTDTVRGEMVVAFVAARDMPRETLFDELRGKLKPSEIPDRIEFVKAFPRTQSGKIDRAALKRIGKELV